MGNKAYDFSSKKKDFLPKNDQICPVGGSVGGCGARAVSRKTPIYFIIYLLLSTPSDCSSNPLHSTSPRVSLELTRAHQRSLSVGDASL